MNRFVGILLSGLLLVQPGLALTPAPAPPEPDAQRSEVSDELGAFVRQALDKGLLDPVGTARDREAAAREAAESAAIEPPRPAAAEPRVTSGPIDCSQPYPLDFADYEALSQYTDIYAYREESPVAGEAAGAGNPGVKLAKAYLALDLGSEAAMTVKSGQEAAAIAVLKLSELLDVPTAPPAAYFAELAGCYPQARIWHGLALLSQQDKSGATLIESNLSDFRKLPLQLRDRAAMIAIPELDGLGQRTLAKLLIASFSDEEIANSAQLRFSQAVIDLGDGNPGAEQLIGSFLIQSRFQEDALSALIRHKRPVNSTVRDILVDDMVNRIELAQQNADVREDLRFVLDEMSSASMYVPMMKLADLPSMQSEEARSELKRHLASSLLRDLASDDSLRNLVAIEALMEDKGLLDSVPERAALYENATVLAVRLGFGSLGDALAQKSQGGEGVAEQRAVLAYRQKNLPEVFELAARYPANQKITLIAARAAIESRDSTKLSVYEARLRMEPDTILALIEQDAASTNWLVSDKVFRAASALTDEGHKARVDRVLRLKADGPAPAPEGRVSMSSIPGKLSRARDSLDQLSAEMP